MLPHNTRRGKGSSWRWCASTDGPHIPPALNARFVGRAHAHVGFPHTHTSTTQPPDFVAGPLVEQLTRARLDRASLTRAVFTYAMWAEGEKEKERADKEKERADKEKERADKAETEKELEAERVERKGLHTELLRLRGCLSLRGAWGE